MIEIVILLLVIGLLAGAKLAGRHVDRIIEDNREKHRDNLKPRGPQRPEKGVWL